MLPEEDAQGTPAGQDMEGNAGAESSRAPERAGVETTEPIVLSSESDNQVEDQANEQEEDAKQSAFDNIIPISQISHGAAVIGGWHTASDIGTTLHKKSEDINNSETMASIRTRTNSAWEKAKETATPVWEKTVDVTKATVEKTKDVTKATVEKTKEISHRVVEDAKPMAEKASEKAIQGWKYLTNAVRKGASKAAEVAGKAKDDIKAAVDEEESDK